MTPSQRSTAASEHSSRLYRPACTRPHTGDDAHTEAHRHRDRTPARSRVQKSDCRTAHQREVFAPQSMRDELHKLLIVTTTIMLITFDPAKPRKTLRERGIDFRRAKEVLAGSAPKCAQRIRRTMAKCASSALASSMAAPLFWFERRAGARDELFR